MDFTMFSCVGWRGASPCGHVRRGWKAPPKTKTPRALDAASRGPVPVASLLAQAETLDERAVGLDVAALQVVELAASLADELQQSAARVEVLDVRLEMLGEHVD